MKQLGRYLRDVAASFRLLFSRGFVQMLREARDEQIVRLDQWAAEQGRERELRQQLRAGWRRER